MSKENVDCSIQVLITQTQKQELARIANDTGESRSALIRRAIEGLKEYRREI